MKRLLLGLLLTVTTVIAQGLSVTTHWDPGRRIYAGKGSAYILLVVTYGTTPPADLYYTSLTADHAGISVVPWCSHSVPNCWGASPKFHYNLSNTTIYTHVRISADATVPAGNHTATVLLTSSGVTATIDIPLVVLALPATPSPTRLRKAPLPAAAVTRWETNMLDRAVQWFNLSTTYSFSDSGNRTTNVWYYDGARVYFEIADYTDDATWEDMAYSIASQYKTWVTTHTPAVNVGTHVFPHGLYMAYLRTNDATYRDALYALADNSPASATFGGGATDPPAPDPVDEAYIRECTYVLQSFVLAAKAGRGSYYDAKIERSVDYILGYFSTLFTLPIDEAYPSLHQTFMDGLAMAALIEYYDYTVDLGTPDRRIPGEIKRALDWIWSNLWTANGMVSNPYPVNHAYPRLCDNGNAGYPEKPVTCGMDYTENYYNAFLVPAYAWYWKLTGDDTYRTRADELWNAQTYLTWQGKEFSVSYRWTFDYIRWRSSGSTWSPLPTFHSFGSGKIQ